MQLHRISEHVYWSIPDSRTDRPVLGAIVGERGTLMVDAGNSPAHAEEFLAALEEAGVSAPRYVVLTHWHWDHVFGTSLLDVPTFAHQKTKRIVTEMAQLDWRDEALDRRVEEGREIEFCRDYIKVELTDEQRADLVIRPPDIAFTDRLEIELGGVTCHIAHVGGDHAADSSIVYVPQDKILFLGDCLGVSIYDGPRYYTTRNLFSLLDRLLAYDIDSYLAGHDPDPWPRTEMEKDTETFKTIGQVVETLAFDRAAVVAALEERFGTPLDEFQGYCVDAFLAGQDR
ncbi:MAG: MBL fold metallo-hydrolase [Chloroflexota bacterium]|nr:MBL fold metallo-hydrolase [Chloroflexota bacterium]